MFAFVPDASVTLTWCFEDEAGPETDGLLHRLKNGERALVPAHWALEIANGALTAVKRGRISREKAQRFLEDVGFLPITTDKALGASECTWIFALAEKYRLTAYDAAYLELAIRTGVPLASRDDDLRKAAAVAGVARIV